MPHFPSIQLGGMRLKSRWIAIITIGPPCVAVMWALWPSSAARINIPLADGTSFILTDTDSGKTLLYGGGRWQRFLCKITGRNLPQFVRNQPMISPAAYTNGIAFSLRRDVKGTNNLLAPWNGTGQIYLVDLSGTEIDCALRAVLFYTEMRGTNYVVAAEVLNCEAPTQTEAELHLRIRETNHVNGTVSTHDFRVKNPSR